MCFLFPCIRWPAHLCVLVAVSAGVLQILTCALVAVRVQVDGAGRSLGQELSPDVLHPLCYVLLGHPLQVLHCQPEPAIQTRKEKKNNLLTSRECKDNTIKFMITIESSKELHSDSYRKFRLLSVQQAVLELHLGKTTADQVTPALFNPGPCILFTHTN